MNRWTAYELDLLKKYYPNSQRHELLKIFSGKTFMSIRKKAKRVGIKRDGDFIQMKNDTIEVMKNIDLMIDKYNDGASLSKIASEKNMCSATIKKMFVMNKFVQKDKSNAHRRYKLNENYFDVIDTEDKAYFLGFIFADGFVYRGKGNFEIGIHIHKKDINILRVFKEKINSESPIKIDIDGYAIFRVYSKHTFDRLVETGCVERKSLVLKFPSTNIVPRQLLHHFIRGYFDGDGSIKRNSNAIRCVQVGFVSSHDFINELNNVLSLNANTNKISPYNRINYSTLNYGGKGNAKKLFDFMYKDSTIYLKRKRNRFIQYLNLSLPIENLD